MQGRKEIKDEYNKATAITKALSTIIQTGKLNFNQEVGQNNNTYEINKAFGDELVNILQNDKLSINEKENFIAKFTKDLAKSKGYDLRNLQIRFINDKTALGANNQPFQGNYNAQINTITLNLANISNLNDFTNTLGHELSHAIMANQNKFIPQDIKQNDYADLKGRIFTDYLNKALDLQGYGNLSSYDINIDYTNSQNLNTLANNQKLFDMSDKSKSDNVDLVLFNKQEIPLKQVSIWLQDKALDNVFSIAGHGNVGLIYDERKETDYLTAINEGKFNQISIKDLANEIRNTDKWKNNKIDLVKLYNCYGASSNYGKDNSVAQLLANELGIPVSGYTGEYYWEIFPPISKPAENSKSKIFFPQKDKK